MAPSVSANSVRCANSPRVSRGISSGAALSLAAAAAGLPIERLALYEQPFMVGPHARAVPPAAERAARVKAPSLVIHGSKTWPVLADAAVATATALPVAHHRVLKGQTHNVGPGVLAPVLKDFFGS